VPVDRTLVTLAYASLAAAVSAVGVGPFAFGGRPPRTHIGLANALAAGLMLGAAYILMSEGLTGPAAPGAAGAVLGILFVYGSHAFAGTADLRLNLADDPSPEYGYKVVVVNSLHSASEGIAIGVAMFLELRLGIFMALALAVHNVAEATALCSVLIPRGVSIARAAALSVLTNVSQPLLAVTVYAVLTAAPDILPPTLGFAVGAIIYLTVVELLPEAYAETHEVGIAVTAAVSMSAVALLRVLLP
jgi:zinc transporter ZupT